MFLEEFGSNLNLSEGCGMKLIHRSKETNYLIEMTSKIVLQHSPCSLGWGPGGSGSWHCSGEVEVEAEVDMIRNLWKWLGVWQGPFRSPASLALLPMMSLEVQKQLLLVMVEL